jgi:hypothetical protein
MKFSYNDSDAGSTFIAELTGSTVENIRKILKEPEKFRLNEN